MFTPYLPYPLHSGGQTRSYNLIANLSSKHEISLFSLIKEEKEKKYVPKLAKFCRKVEVFRRPKRPWTLRNVLLTGFSPYPFLVIRNLAREARRAVEEELAREKYDLIHAETFYTMPHIPRTDVPVLLVEQTIEFPVYLHFVEESRLWPIKPLLYVDVLKIKLWEKHFWRKSAKVVAVSEADKRVMEREVAGLGVEIVPNGIDVAYFRGRMGRKPRVPTALFVGNFTWLQNIEAVEFLVTKVWPKVIRQVPGARLRVVGQAVPDKVRQLEKGQKGVEIEGFVDDIREAYGGADLLLAPIFGPGGTRLKILEAMASGLPVVSTSVGVKGLGIKGGKEAIVSNTPDEMAEAVVRLFNKGNKARNMAKVAREFVKENYSWKKIAEGLDKIYREVGEGNSKIKIRK